MVHVGLTASVELAVTRADTAEALGSGDVPVLGTPRVVALCEEATVEAAAGSLDPGQTTVDTRVDIEHLRPTAVGGRVVATATLAAADDRQLTFDVTVVEGEQEVARGTVIRAVVDRERFVSRLR